MKNIKNRVYLFLFFTILVTTNVYSMGLRSFVALPVEKDGAVVRFSYEHTKDTNTDFMTTSAAYGLSSDQTLLLGMPYGLSPSGNNQMGDVSILYRHLIWKKDSFSGTKRLGLLGGAIVPTDSQRDGAVQAGFVYTYFKDKNEIDIDALYQKGLENRKNSARYDISWQHRLFPNNRPIWGLSQELNSVLELNGRYKEGDKITHQVTTGLQLINKKRVLEGGIVKDINNEKELRYILSIRFHF